MPSEKTLVSQPSVNSKSASLPQIASIKVRNIRLVAKVKQNNIPSLEGFCRKDVTQHLKPKSGPCAVSTRKENPGRCSAVTLNAEADIVARREALTGAMPKLQKQRAQNTLSPRASTKTVVAHDFFTRQSESMRETTSSTFEIKRQAGPWIAGGQCKTRLNAQLRLEVLALNEIVCRISAFKKQGSV